jgi:hypothetical protein
MSQQPPPRGFQEWLRSFLNSWHSTITAQPHGGPAGPAGPPGGGGGGDVTAEYLLLAADVGLANSRILTAGANITLTDAGAGSTLTIAATGAARPIPFLIDGGGNVITTGSKGFLEVPAGTIARWTLLGDVAGSIVIDVKRIAYASFPTTVSIVGGGTAPTLSAVQYNQATPSGWTSTTLVAGDILEFVVSSPVTVTRCTISLWVTP